MGQVKKKFVNECNEIGILCLGKYNLYKDGVLMKTSRWIL